MIWWPEEVPTLVGINSKSQSTITLRPISPADAHNVFLGVQDPEIPRFTSIPSIYPIESALSFTGARERRRFHDKSEIVFVIEDTSLTSFKDSNDGGSNSRGNFAGVISLHTIDLGTQKAEVGYWLAKEARGFGICTKAIEMITDYGLFTIGFQRILAKVNTENMASKKALLNAGYTQCNSKVEEVTNKDGLPIELALYEVKQVSI